MYKWVLFSFGAFIFSLLFLYIFTGRSYRYVVPFRRMHCLLTFGIFILPKQTSFRIFQDRRTDRRTTIVYVECNPTCCCLFHLRMAHLISVLTIREHAMTHRTKILNSWAINSTKKWQSLCVCVCVVCAWRGYSPAIHERASNRKQRQQRKNLLKQRNNWANANRTHSILRTPINFIAYQFLLKEMYVFRRVWQQSVRLFDEINNQRST